MSSLSVDWSAPWLAPYRARGERVAACWQAGGSLAQALNAQRSEGMPRFVPQAALPAGEGYEAFVRREHAVPTRECLHDFFNGLVWLHEPALKQRLNELHASQRPRADGRRGAVRDGVTLFDENGGFLQAPVELLQALRERAWQTLFVQLRPLWREARVTLVGHALLEKLLQPRKPITVHLLPAGAALDEAVFAAKPFLPMPVLGVPGWWPANEDPAFYDDPGVFRPAQTVSAGRKPSIER
jgi:hypothetical protein